MNLKTALDLWRRGLSIFPIPHRSKVAVIKWGDYQKRLPTEDEIRGWFTGEPTNAAIATGAVSGVVAVDADSPEGLAYIVEHLPRTPWQTRTRKGYHLFYRVADVHVGNKARLHTPKGRLAIDVRGHGGYVISPGSIHPSGFVYRMAGDWSVPKERLPVFWPGWIKRPKPPAQKQRRVGKPTGDIVERARRYLSSIPRPEIGQGSDEKTLYAACKLARGFGLSEADAVSLLWDWAGGRDGWTIEWIESKVRNAVRYGKENVGALR